MTPERRREFENVWPALSRRVKNMVCRKGVTGGDVDDLVQEAALRLYRTWDQVDPTRDPWPLVSTITLNLLRDRARPRPIREIAADHVPETADSYEVERAGLARLELGRVESAMAMLSASHRTALLSEIGDGASKTADSEATRMLRMRARRRLAALLEKASAILIPVKLNRLSELAEWAFGSRQAALSTVSCLLCVALGTVTAFTAVLAPPHAYAHTTKEHRLEVAAVALQTRALPSHAGLRRAALRSARLNERRAAVHSGAATSKKAQKQQAAAPSALPETPPLPQPPKAPPLPAPPPLPKAPLPGPGDQDALQTVHDTVSWAQKTVSSLGK